MSGASAALGAGRVFICGDTGQAEMLAQVEDVLRGRGHEVWRGPPDTPGEIRRYTPAERAALIDRADVAVFTVRHACTRELMAGARRLRGVCYPAIGVETLDLPAARELGVIVGNGAVRGNVVGMAEATVMLMLMLLADVQTNIGRIAGGLWRRPGHNGRQLEGKTVGLIGFGRIAREVARRLAPFGVNILTASPRLRVQNTPPGVAKVELDELMVSSDVVCVLTGLSPETRHLVDAARLALMKPTAYLVNTGRGAVVDEAALADALASRRIAGAALDTFEVEPLPADSPLRGLGNVILTPHCVGHTLEGWAELADALVENVQRILGGELPLHCVNPDAQAPWRARLGRLAASPNAELERTS